MVTSGSRGPLLPSYVDQASGVLACPISIRFGCFQFEIDDLEVRFDYQDGAFKYETGHLSDVSSISVRRVKSPHPSPQPHPRTPAPSPDAWSASPPRSSPLRRRPNIRVAIPAPDPMAFSPTTPSPVEDTTDEVVADFLLRVDDYVHALTNELANHTWLPDHILIALLMWLPDIVRQQ